ncbi:MAG: hypothetical protein RKH07_02980 [Gammaproteobacteria bacterium]
MQTPEQFAAEARKAVKHFEQCIAMDCPLCREVINFSIEFERVRNPDPQTPEMAAR